MTNDSISSKGIEIWPFPPTSSMKSALMATALRTDKIAVRDDHIYQAAGLTTEIQQLTTTIMAKQMQFNQGCVPMPPP